MANRLSLDCPIDGQSLATNRAPDKVTLPPTQNVGEHAHITYALTLTCANGHVWRLVADIEATRTA
jgi:hypothetical protein